MSNPSKRFAAPKKPKTEVHSVCNFEGAFARVLLDNHDMLDDPMLFPEIASKLHLAVWSFIESGDLLEIQEIKPDWERKEISILCKTPEVRGPTYLPCNTRWVVLSWKNINKDVLKTYHEKMEEKVNNGTTSGNC